MPDEIQENEEQLEVSDEQAAPVEESAISEASLPALPIGPPKPRSNIFTLLLIISFVCLIVAIYLVGYELNRFYGVTFGGFFSAPTTVSGTVTPGK